VYQWSQFATLSRDTMLVNNKKITQQSKHKKNWETHCLRPRKSQLVFARSSFYLCKIRKATDCLTNIFLILLLLI
jgi:hypothetical protein